MSIGTIAAVIVTYNRAELLEKVLLSLKSQKRTVDCVIIINNASTDNTLEILNKYINSELNLDIVNLEKNIGGAGGFHYGAKKAYEDGYDAIWFMDDDTVPETEALNYLEQDILNFHKETGYNPAFICSTVLWKNDDLCEMNIPKPIWDWPRFIYTQHQVALVESCSFVSVLITRQKIKEAGYPIKDFFIWYDDVEYTTRLSKFGYPGLLSIKSKVHHLLLENKGVNYYMLTEQNWWKYRYGIRNEGAIILRDQGWFKYILFAISRLRIVYNLKISKSTKLGMLKACIAAIKFKPKIEYPN